MKKHNGMRPMDIVVLLKIIVKGDKPWLNKDLASELNISASEVSESLNRSKIAGLIDGSHKNVMRKSFLEFLQFGLKYVFPQKPGAMVRGIPTSHSAPVMAKHFVFDEKYVWPDAHGEVRGQTIEPLYHTVPKAAKQDQALYDLLALCDALRVGRVREKDFAKKELEKRLLNLAHEPA